MSWELRKAFWRIFWRRHHCRRWYYFADSRNATACVLCGRVFVAWPPRRVPV